MGSLSAVQSPWEGAHCDHAHSEKHSFGAYWNKWPTYVFSGEIRNLAIRLLHFFSCSTHMSMKFILLINFKVPTIVGNLTFISKINTILSVKSRK